MHITFLFLRYATCFSQSFYYIMRHDSGFANLKMRGESLKTNISGEFTFFLVFNFLIYCSSIRLGIRACVVLIPLLGVTWLFGLLSSTHKAFVYIFTILNTTQVNLDE